MQLIKINKYYPSLDFFSEKIENPQPRKLTAQWVKIGSKLVCQWKVIE